MSIKKLSVLLLCLCLVASMLLTGCERKNKKKTTTATTTTAAPLGAAGDMFPFPSLNVQQYASLDRSVWDGATVTLRTEDYVVTDADVDDYIHGLQAELLPNVPYAEEIKDRPIVKGDTVYIYYTGTVDGVAFEGGSNVISKKPSPLTIGSGAFIDGFEDGLVGVVPSATSLTKKTSGTVEAGDVVYFAYTYAYADDDGTQLSYDTFTAQRIDLANPEAALGAGFVAELVGKGIGDNLSFVLFEDFDGDGKDESKTYNGTVVCVAEEQGVDVLATFPEVYPNAPELAGVTATFTVFVSYIEELTYPELTEDFITVSAGYVPKTDNVIGEYRAYVKTLLEADMENRKKADKETAFVESLVKNITVSSYPEGSVAYYYDYYYEEVHYYYEYYKYYFGTEFPFDNLSDYAAYFYGQPEGTDGLAFLRETAQDLVKQNLAIFLIGRELGYTVTDAEILAHAQMLADQYNSMQTQTVYTADKVIAEHGTVYLECAVMYTEVMLYCLPHTQVNWE